MDAARFWDRVIAHPKGELAERLRLKSGPFYRWVCFGCPCLHPDALACGQGVSRCPCKCHSQYQENLTREPS